MAEKYYQEGHGGTDAGTEANPYASLTTLAAGVSDGDTAHCSGTATLAAHWQPEDGVIYKQWVGETAWKMDGNASFMPIYVGGARTDIRISDLEGYNSSGNGGRITSVSAGTFIFNNVILRNNPDEGLSVDGQAGGTITWTGGALHTNTGSGLNVIDQSGGLITVETAIYSNVEDGVHWSGQTGGAGILNGCNIYDNDDGPGQEVYVISCGGGAQQVTNCRIHDGAKTGVRVNASASTDIEVSWNRIWDIATENAIGVAASASVKIVGNVLYNNQYGIVLETTSPNAEVKNNVISNTTARPIRIVGAAAIVGYDGDNNCIFTHGTDYYWNATSYATLALWKAATSQDSNSNDTDPTFVKVASGNFHLLAGSPCINAGVVVAGIATTDPDGVPCVGLPDIGAHNYYQETIESDYSNIRGANYLPTYDTINSNPPALWTGVSGPDVAWDNFDKDDYLGGTGYEVHQQLVRLKQAGFNTIRVWLPYKPTETGYDSYTYVGDKVEFLAKLTAYADICASAGMYLIPIIFDSFTKSPSQAEVTAIIADYAASDAKEFIDDILAVVDLYPATIIMFDIYNEPWAAVAPTAADVQSLIASAAAQIKTHDSDYVTMVGAASWTSAAPSVAIAEDANIDVLSIHPYCVSPYPIETLLAKTLSIAAKPVIASECGSPGWGALYSDAISGMKPVSKVAAGGIGWCVYQAMVGWADVASTYPHVAVSGMMHHDGQVREVREIKAVRQAAANDGVPVDALYTNPEIDALQISGSSGDFYPQFPCAIGYGGWQWMIDICNAENRRIDDMVAAERDAIARTFYTFTSYDILGASADAFEGYYKWPGKSTTWATAILARYTTDPEWSTMTQAQEIALINDWRRELRAFLPTQITPELRQRFVR